MNKKQLIKKWALKGNSLQDIATRLGVSRQFVHRVLKNKLPKTFKKWKALREDLAAVNIKKKRILLQKIKDKSTTQRIEKFGRPVLPRSASELLKRQARMFTRKRQNAKNRQIEFTLSFTDLVFPVRCPVLGIKLDYFSPSMQDNSPSFDRIKTSKGYTPKNVAIVSWRANRIKNDGTPKEHKLIYQFYKTA